MVMMTLFRNYRPPPAGSTPDQPKAGHIAYSLKPGSLDIQPELLPGRYAKTRIIPKARSCSAHTARQSPPLSQLCQCRKLSDHPGYPPYQLQ